MKYLTLLIALATITQINEVSAIQVIHRAPSNASPYQVQMINGFNAQQEQMEMQRQQLNLQRQQVQAQQDILRYYRYGY